MLKLELVGDKQLVTKLDRMPRNITIQVTRRIHMLVQMLRNYIIRNKLSGQVLNHRTGGLWRSISTDTISEPSYIEGKVFASADCAYAAIHEYGGKTKAHIIEAKKAKSLAFTGSSGSTVFAKRVNHPGSKMPERSFMRSSLTDKKKTITNEISDAVGEGIK